MKIAILTINKPSFLSAIKLANILKSYKTDIYINQKTAEIIDIQKYQNQNIIVYDKLDDILPNGWKIYDAIIAIIAIGAIIRKIAPLLKSKQTDPAVIVVSLDLTKIVPILSGHLGGANQLSQVICDNIQNSVNFITTATDQTKTISFEMWAKQYNMDIFNIKQLANISNRLINKQNITICSYKNIFDSLEYNVNIKYSALDNIVPNSIVITPFSIDTKELYFKPKISLGIGCNRDTSMDIIQKSVEQFLAEYNLTYKQIKSFNSFEAKKDEIGLLQFAKSLNIPLYFFTKDDINQLPNQFSQSASTKFFGLKGVAEPSAILGSDFKELVIPKTVYYKSVTIACAV